MSKLSAIFLVIPLTIHANENLDEFHFETAMSYSRIDAKFIDGNAWQASLNYYWNPITYSNQYPNREATFINRLGSVGVQYRGDADDEKNIDIRSNGIDAALVYAAKDLNHVFQLEYSWLNAEFEEARFSNKADLHHIDFGYQYYLLDNLTVGGGFGASFINESFRHSEKYDYRLQTKYLMDLGGENWLALKARYHYSQTENNFEDSSHNVDASAEYYFNPATSLQVAGGASFTEYNDDSSTDTGFVSLALYHYLTDQIVINMRFKNLFYKKSDTQVYTFGLNYLF